MSLIPTFGSLVITVRCQKYGLNFYILSVARFLIIHLGIRITIIIQVPI